MKLFPKVMSPEVTQQACWDLKSVEEKFEILSNIPFVRSSGEFTELDLKWIALGVHNLKMGGV